MVTIIVRKIVFADGHVINNKMPFSRNSNRLGKSFVYISERDDRGGDERNMHKEALLSMVPLYYEDSSSSSACFI